MMANKDFAFYKQNRNKNIDILIVGAGLSGLTSAFDIARKESSLQVRILEASERIGGQLTTTSLGEVGAKWISEDQHHVYCLLKTLKVATHKRNVISNQLKAYRDLDAGVFSRLAKYELMRYINELELKTEYCTPAFVKYNGRSMYSHIQNRLFFNCSRKYMLNLVLLISGVDAKDIKFRDFLSLCYTCGGIKRIIELYIEVPNYSLLEFCSKNLLCQLLHNLKDTEILCGRKVIAIHQYRDYVQVRDSANEYHTANAVILAIPWSCSQNIRFWPMLPTELQTPLSPADKQKHIITSFLISYNEGYWRQKGFSGHFIKHEPIIIAYEYRPTIYSGFMIHEEGIEPLVKSIAIHEFAKVFGEEMLLPQEFEQFSYELNNLAHLPLTTPWKRVIWSSSAAAGTCYRGYLGGAVQSGLRAAMNALLVCRPQIVNWQDIVEIQCHNYLCQQKTAWSSIILSSCNLYNVTSCTAFICGLLLILTKAYKKHT